jgi:hypothetical protein
MMRTQSNVPSTPSHLLRTSSLYIACLSTLSASGTTPKLLVKLITDHFFQQILIWAFHFRIYDPSTKLRFQQDLNIRFIFLGPPPPYHLQEPILLLRPYLSLVLQSKNLSRLTKIFHLIPRTPPNTTLDKSPQPKIHSHTAPTHMTTHSSITNLPFCVQQVCCPSGGLSCLLRIPSSFCR